MAEQSVLGEGLEAAARLSPEDQEILMEVLRWRRSHRRREEIAREIAAARKEFQAGECRCATPDELRKEILG